MAGRRVIVTGATGMVGGLALELCLAHPDVSGVTAVGRRPTGVSHAKLRDVVHEDFSSFENIADVFAEQDVCLYCLGVYGGTVSDDVFRAVTTDYTLSFAQALHARSPGAAFCFLSGQGADPSGKSRMAFARYKGAAESGLRELGFGRLHVFRAGYIHPGTPRTEPSLVYRTMRALYPALSAVYPNVGVESEDLARAMVHAGLFGVAGHDDPVLENRDIRLLAASLRQE